MQKGKSARVDSNLAELVQAGEEEVITAIANNLQANPVDPVFGHHTSQERQLAVVPELPNNQPRQLPKQSHTEDHTEEIEATSEEDNC